MKLHPAKITGRLGMNHVERVALKAGCKPIPIPEDLDTGIDGFLEFGGDDGQTSLAAVQVKRGNSFFDALGPKCSIDQRHARYWAMYPLPVLLIIVQEDDASAFWMDARQYFRTHPPNTAQSTTVRLPSHQVFDETALRSEIGPLGVRVDFGDAIAALASESPEDRFNARSLLFHFRFERRTVFCLAAALRLERDIDLLAGLCDFYSRYLPHPEIAFGASPELKGYARDLLREFPTSSMMRVIAAFHDDEDFGDWSGATMIYEVSEEDIWDGHSIITRGTVQQGIAEVMRLVTDADGLLRVVLAPSISLRDRKSAVGLFAYLGHHCSPERITELMQRETDPPFVALLHWLRYWMADPDVGV